MCQTSTSAATELKYAHINAHLNDAVGQDRLRHDRLAAALQPVHGGGLLVDAVVAGQRADLHVRKPLLQHVQHLVDTLGGVARAAERRPWPFLTKSPV